MVLPTLLIRVTAAQATTALTAATAVTAITALHMLLLRPVITEAARTAPFVPTRLPTRAIRVTAEPATLAPMWQMTDIAITVLRT